MGSSLKVKSKVRALHGNCFGNALRFPDMPGRKRLRGITEAAILAMDRMPAPCRKCGATKTEPVRRGLTYQFFRVLGYRLRKCARCRQRRLVAESVFQRRNSGVPLPSYAAATGRSGEDQPASFRAADFDPDGFDGCPRCGGRDFKQTPRNGLERLLGRAPMARCRSCDRRFTYPKP